METDIIKQNEDCDAEYFLCSWFNIDSLPKRRMILDATAICELMEEYHRQKPKAKLESVTDEDIKEWAQDHQFDDGLDNCVDILCYAAKAFKNGLIKHT